MPRRLPPYVYPERTRHGRRVYYFRRVKGPRTRLPDYEAPDFEEAYQAALTSTVVAKKRVAGAGSLAWLITRYRETSDYLALSTATRKQRDNIFQGIVKTAGHVAFKAITRKTILDGREKRAATPAQSRNFLDAMRGLFAWALQAEHVSLDPTVGVENPKRPKNAPGFPVWTDDDVALYEARWHVGTKERVWLHVLLYTGLRRGDAVIFGRQHIKNGSAAIRTEKNGTEAHFRIMPQLVETLTRGPTGDLAFIAGANGDPLTKETFGNYFREACNAAGVRKSAHGLRKLAATRAAEASFTVAELEATFAWSGGTMASHYTKSANRKRLAEQGGRKMENAYSPHPNGNSPHPEKAIG